MITEKSKKENKAIGREEIVYTVKHEGKSQPSRSELSKLLKAKLGSEYFVIIKIKSRFGKADSEILVHTYKDEKTMKYFEQEYLFKRTKEEKAPEASAEASK